MLIFEFLQKSMSRNSIPNDWHRRIKYVTIKKLLKAFPKTNSHVGIKSPPPTFSREGCQNQAISKSISNIKINIKIGRDIKINIKIKFKYRTDKSLNSFTINENDIFLIIKNLNADKAHGWDNISVRIIQLCGKETILPLQLLFKSMLEEGIFPDDWKKSNVVPVHKKESTNLIKSYRPICLFPIFSKIFERLIFNSLYNYLMQNKLFTECQSGFIPGDSCVAQLLSITHEIYKCFDCNPPADTRVIFPTFLIFRKAFDNVCMKV